MTQFLKATPRLPVVDLTRTIDFYIRTFGFHVASVWPKVAIQRPKAPGYTLVNLAANYEVSEQVSIFGRIDKLFNVRYQNPTGFLAPGFGVFDGLKTAFGRQGFL